jgi:phosphatidylglycerol:prolipoprotein diacylglycerol transferase
MYPTLFEFGPFTITSYGVTLGTAFVVGLLVAKKLANEASIPPARVLDFSIYAIIGGVLGARIYYFLFYQPSIFWKAPWRILVFWEGGKIGIRGLAIHGGLIGGIIALIIFTRRYKISVFKFTDCLSPAVLLGTAIGRIGCFLNGCCYGYPTELPWGITFPLESAAGSVYPNEKLHPTQLYESYLCFLAFLILMIVRKKKLFPGSVFFFHLLLYSLVRSIVEFFRADNLYLWETKIKIAWVISGGIILGIIPLLVIFSIKERSN